MHTQILPQKNQQQRIENYELNYEFLKFQVQGKNGRLKEFYKHNI